MYLRLNLCTVLRNFQSLAYNIATRLFFLSCLVISDVSNSTIILTVRLVSCKLFASYLLLRFTHDFMSEDNLTLLFGISFSIIDNHRATSMWAVCLVVYIKNSLHKMDFPTTITITWLESPSNLKNDFSDCLSESLGEPDH